MNDKYKEYLLSAEWRYKRELVFRSRWRQCQKCFCNHDLVIHHWTYTRIFHEKLSDLFVLCSSCHDQLHKKYWTNDLLRATKSFIKNTELVPRKKLIRKSLEERSKTRIERKNKELVIAIKCIKQWIKFSESWLKSIRVWKKAKELI